MRNCYNTVRAYEHHRLLVNKQPYGLFCISHTGIAIIYLVTSSLSGRL